MRFRLIGVVLGCLTTEVCVAQTSNKYLKGTTDIYKPPSYVYQNPGGFFQGPVLCETLTSRDRNYPLQAKRYCEDALRECVVVRLIEMHLDSGVNSEENIDEDALKFARDQRDHKLISCQLALDAAATGDIDFAKLVGYR